MVKLNFTPDKAKDAIIAFIRDWFDENGSDCVAVLGVSGGVDSSVTAALLVEALGKERVVGVLMPNHVQSDYDDAVQLCEHLGIRYMTIDIGQMVDTLKWNVNYALNNIPQGTRTVCKQNKVSELASNNIPPRMRMMTLYAVAQSINGRVVYTGNYSEYYLGYFTKGDNVADVAPLLQFTKTEVIQIGRLLNLPENLMNKVPSDGLCSKTDEEAFGFTYEELDQVLRSDSVDVNKDSFKKPFKRWANTRHKRQTLPSCDYYEFFGYHKEDR